MKIQNVMAWGVFLLAGILVSVDTSDAQERTEREKTLEQQVELLLQRVEALENRLDEKEKVEANADSVPPATDPEAVTTSLKGGLQLKTQDGDFTMKIGGRL
ncbi:MAG: hypothetical protein QGG09_19495, partial [Pirellulaceae bacterium]|nr:hypothetical protein [Pirellulaceae bacterium]